MCLFALHLIFLKDNNVGLHRRDLLATGLVVKQPGHLFSKRMVAMHDDFVHVFVKCPLGCGVHNVVVLCQHASLTVVQRFGVILELEASQGNTWLIMNTPSYMGRSWLTTKSLHPCLLPAYSLGSQLPRMSKWLGVVRSMAVL